MSAENHRRLSQVSSARQNQRWRGGMHHLANESYRSLELRCRQQATLSATSGARQELEAMAREYAAMADWLMRQSPEQSQAQVPPDDL